MARPTLAQALDIIEALTADELAHVQQAVQERLKQRSIAAATDALHQSVVAAGLVKGIKAPPARRSDERPLVSIGGKLLSETIVEERR